jgi:hypothetical protein
MRRCIVRKTDPFVVTAILQFHEAGYSSRKIAKISGSSRATVLEVKKRARNAGITYAKALELGHLRTAALLYPPRPCDAAVAEKHEALCADRQLNMKKLWKEYIQENPDGIRYTQFCAAMNKLGKPERRKAKSKAQPKAPSVGL